MFFFFYYIISMISKGNIKCLHFQYSHSTVIIIRLLTVGGTPFDAMHKYAPACWRLTRLIFNTGPSSEDTEIWSILNLYIYIYLIKSLFHNLWAMLLIYKTNTAYSLRNYDFLRSKVLHIYNNQCVFICFLWTPAPVWTPAKPRMLLATNKHVNILLSCY